MRRRAGELDGRRVFYHYLQNDLLQKDVWLFQMLAARLVVSLGVWLPPEVYRRLPVLLPFAARDPSSRGNSGRGIPDQWGSPSAEGLLRDDNSLIKNLPRSLRIESKTNPHYHGKRLGNGFVACHVWRRLADSTFASRDPDTYSFAANLVWLPAQVAELTDREGSFVQAYVQALARKIFKGVDVPTNLKQTVASIWDRLPAAGDIPEQGLPEACDLSFFATDAHWIERRGQVIRDVVDGLETVVSGRELKRKIVCSRYTEGLPRVPVKKAQQLRGRLEEYAAAAGLHESGAADYLSARSD